MNIVTIINRLIIAAIFIPAVLYMVYVPVLLFVFIGVLATFGMREFHMFRSAIINRKWGKSEDSEHQYPPRMASFGDHVQMFIRMGFSASVVVAVYLGLRFEKEPLGVLMQVMLIVLLVLMTGTTFGWLHAGGSKRKPGELNVEDLYGALLDWFGVMYTGGFFSFVLMIQKMNPLLLVVTLCGNWACDGMALAFGKGFGKYKILGPLHSKLSPNKTNEGAVGGVIGSMLASLILHQAFIRIEVIHANFFIPELSVYLFLGAAVGALGVIGDLVESYIKRLANVKDSGQFFGSHGGVLDRADSALFTFPIIFLIGVYMT